MWNKLNLRFYPYRQYPILDRHLLRTPRLLHLKLYFDMFIRYYLYTNIDDCFLLLINIFINQIFIYIIIITWLNSQLTFFTILFIAASFSIFVSIDFIILPFTVDLAIIGVISELRDKTQLALRKYEQSGSNSIISYPSRYRRLGIRLKTFSL